MRVLKNKKILIVSLLQNNGTTGVQTFQKNLCKTLNELNCDFKLITPHLIKPLFILFYFYRKIIKIFRLYENEEYLHNKFSEFLLKILLKKNLSNNTLIFAQDPLCAKLVQEAFSKYRISNFKVFLFAHYNISKVNESQIKGYKNSSKLINYYKKNEIFIYKNIDGIIFLNRNIYFKARKIFTINKKKVFFLNNFLNENFTYNKINKYNPKCKLISLGSLEKRKNQIDTILIFQELLKIDKNYTIDIYGTGPDKQYLKNQIKKMNLEKNIFLKGFDKNISKKLSDYDAIIHTPLLENSPFVLIESFANSVIPFVYKVGGLITMIKNGYNGYFINNNYKLSAKKIDTILKNNDEREKIRKKCFEVFMSKYSKENFIKNLVKIL